MPDNFEDLVSTATTAVVRSVVDLCQKINQVPAEHYKELVAVCKIIFNLNICIADAFRVLVIV